MSTKPQAKQGRGLLLFLLGFVAGDFVHAYLMDRQDSGDFFDPEGLMILLAAGPFTAPVACLSIMFTCGLIAALLPLLTRRVRGKTGDRHPHPG
ncbi:MAG: hypothetical protein QF721_00730 [Verrucomicrobiota bacterium]|nr:hypothetical protein [Verrucomicrobiota bacterium]MDP7047953.1 hypothetical protein [Verrucomicrobiota bacterium]